MNLEISQSLAPSNDGASHTTLFTNNLTELIASTTSLNPITNAPIVGVSKPNAATGMAIIL